MSDESEHEQARIEDREESTQLADEKMEGASGGGLNTRRYIDVTFADIGSALDAAGPDSEDSTKKVD